MLRVEGLCAGYGQSRVLFDLCLDVSEGEVVTLIGRNGMGKTTTIKSIFGLLRPTAGKILIDGMDMTGKPPHGIAKAGLGLVPEGRHIFANLTVEENLIATKSDRKRTRNWTVEGIYKLFPRLCERRRNMGNQLSGGEQQMLAIGRALMTNPKLLVLDEATEGLSPLMREEIWSCLRELKGQGQSILVVDKNIGALSRLADRHVIVQKGSVVWTGSSQSLKSNVEVKERYLHI